MEGGGEGRRVENAKEKIMSSMAWRAIRSIYKGDEIYVNYGADYWASHDGLDMSSKPVRINHSVPRTGAKGRCVRDGRYIPMP